MCVQLFKTYFWTPVINLVTEDGDGAEGQAQWQACVPGALGHMAHCLPSPGGREEGGPFLHCTWTETIADTQAVSMVITDFQGVPQPQVPLPCSFPSYLCEKLPMLRMEGNDPMQTLLLTRGLSKQHKWKTIEANGNNSRVPKFHTFNTDSKHY